jgi:hypothetical protein
LKRGHSPLITAAVWAALCPGVFIQGTQHSLASRWVPRHKLLELRLRLPHPHFPRRERKAVLQRRQRQPLPSPSKKNSVPLGAPSHIVKTANALRAGDLEYRIENQDQAKPYSGKSVKVTGSLDRKNNTIRARKIEWLPSS